MKPAKTAFLYGCILIAFLAGCGDRDRPKEEKIRITIDQPVQQKTQQEVKQQDAPKKQEAPQERPPQPAERTTQAAPEPAPPAKPLPAQPEKPALDEAKQAMSGAEGPDLAPAAGGPAQTSHKKEEFREYWQSRQGKTVELVGRVQQFKEGKGGFRMTIHYPMKQSRPAFNVVVFGREGLEGRTISAGQTVRYKGNVAKFDPGKPGLGAVIVLTDGVILP